MAAKPTILITGVSGTLGLRLLPQLEQWQVIGVDLRPPGNARLFRFETVDLAEARSCDQLLELMRAYGPDAVVHLAFLARVPRDGEPGDQTQWSTNVVGTSRVIEAIAEHNRMVGGIGKFVFTSS